MVVVVGGRGYGQGLVVVYAGNSCQSALSELAAVTVGDDVGVRRFHEIGVVCGLL